MRIIIWTSAAVATLFAAAHAGGQEIPTDWRWFVDEPADVVTGGEMPEGSWRFETMAPGWHITTRPGATLYLPEHRAEGHFSVESNIFLFPGPSEAGYGVFLGGEAMHGNERAFTAFLLRADGSASIQRVEGDRVRVVVPWTGHEAVKPEDPEGTAANLIRVTARDGQTIFQVNGEVVAEVSQEDAPIEGHFGFRVGHDLNLHVSTLDYIRHVAPTPPSGG